MSHWLMHFFGLDSGSGTPYLAWSGILSDAGEVTLLGGMLAIYRKHSCETRRCWRLGRHVTKAGHHVCARHHPDGAPTHAEVIAAHEAAKGSDLLE